MVPSCFNHSSITQISHHHDPPQTLISCIYQITPLFNSPNFHSLLTLTWSKSNLSNNSHSLSLHSYDPYLSTTISISNSSLFSPTSKSISIPNSSHKLKLHWDFSKANYPPNSPQPISSFYLAISLHGNLQFFLGDLLGDFSRRARSSVALPRPFPQEDPTLLSRRDHVFGRRNCYVSRVEFFGSQCEISIELCGGALKVSVDGEVKVVVKRLAWKFRGNERFFISSNAVDFFWDVLNWVKSDGGGGGSESGPGAFVFQVGEGGVWPEVIGAEAKLMKRCWSSTSNGIGSTTAGAGFPAMSGAAGSSSSVLQWAEESSSDGGRSSCSSSSRSSGINGGGFSLLMYAWRKD